MDKTLVHVTILRSIDTQTSEETNLCIRELLMPSNEPVQLRFQLLPIKTRRLAVILSNIVATRAFKGSGNVSTPGHEIDADGHSHGQQPLPT